MLQINHLIHDIKFQSGKLKGNSSGKIIVSFWNIRTNTKIFPNVIPEKQERKARPVNAKIPLLTQEQLLLFQPPFVLSVHTLQMINTATETQRECASHWLPLLSPTWDTELLLRYWWCHRCPWSRVSVSPSSSPEIGLAPRPVSALMCVNVRNYLDH